MTNKVITNTVVTTLQPKAKTYDFRDTELKGFLVRIYPSGKKSFYVEYGRSKRKLPGIATSLKGSQARELAKKYLANHYLGIDLSEKGSSRLTYPPKIVRWQVLRNGPYMTLKISLA